MGSAMPWDDKMLLRRLELGEDSRVEFKEATFSGDRVVTPPRERIADELAAFANTFGGALIFSVTDAGEPRRLDRRQMGALERFVSEICSDSIQPPLPFVTEKVPLPDGLSTLVVEIERSALVHRSPGRYLSRRGSSAREMSPEALDLLFQRRGRSGMAGPDERIVNGTGRNTLDSALVDRFLSSRAPQPADAELVKLGLLREDDAGILRTTVAGVLLCTEQPHDHIPGAVIEAVRYRGTTQGSAEQHDAKTVTGPLDSQIRQAVNFVRLNTRVAARKAPGRVEVPQFDPRAAFEAIVNAVVHRDYGRANQKIRLFLFDDRLELYSPGALL